eukprot:scaffold219345_cov33-Tisochrysis_lutea.AAC.4
MNASRLLLKRSMVHGRHKARGEDNGEGVKPSQGRRQALALMNKHGVWHEPTHRQGCAPSRRTTLAIRFQASFIVGCHSLQGLRLLTTREHATQHEQGSDTRASCVSRQYERMERIV